MPRGAAGVLEKVSSAERMGVMSRLVYCHELAGILALGTCGFGPDVLCHESGEIEGTSANGHCLACGSTEHPVVEGWAE